MNKEARDGLEKPVEARVCSGYFCVPKSPHNKKLQKTIEAGIKWERRRALRILKQNVFDEISGKHPMMTNEKVAERPVIDRIGGKYPGMLNEKVFYLETKLIDKMKKSELVAVLKEMIIMHDKEMLRLIRERDEYMNRYLDECRRKKFFGLFRRGGSL